MHVYLRQEPVAIEMRHADPEGLVPEGAELVPVAFFAAGNDRPSFRALLPPETMQLLSAATQHPVQLGLLAEEPEEISAEIRAMVGMSIPVDEMPEGFTLADPADGDDDAEPWRASAHYDGWNAPTGDAADDDGDEDEDEPRTVLIAFAPLVRLARRFPNDFAEELADLLETALSGRTKPSLQARVDRMLGEI